MSTFYNGGKEVRSVLEKEEPTGRDGQIYQIPLCPAPTGQLWEFE